MTEARLFRVSNRLKMLIHAGGGLTVRDAVARADKAVEASFPAALGSIDATLVELEASYGASAPADAPRDPRRLYLLSTQIIDVALCLQGSGIDDGARQLCDLADHCAEHGVWDREAIAVHIQALFLLRHTGLEMGADHRRRMLRGLRQVTAKCIAATAGSASATG